MYLSELHTLSKNGVPKKYSNCSVCFDELLILCFMTSPSGTGNADASLVGQATIQTDSEGITEIAIYPKYKSKVLSVKT